jgi:uncharacterized protein with HEPN domain
LREIADAIGMIETFTTGMDFEESREDPKTVAAVERKLQIISEAAIRLGGDAETRCPGLPWRDIRGIGNWLRHQYDRIELSVVWKTVRVDLPLLRAAVLRALNPSTGHGRTVGGIIERQAFHPRYRMTCPRTRQRRAFFGQVVEEPLSGVWYGVWYGDQQDHHHTS